MPGPVEAKVSGLALSLACLIKSGTDCTGMFGFTTRMNGALR